jgi:hypothetical protein
MDLFYHIAQNNVPVVNCSSLHPLFLPPSSSGYGFVFKLSDVGIILREGSFQQASAQIN